MLALGARFHINGIQLEGNFAWLHSDVAICALGLAAVVELLADKVPVVDHALDAVGTVARPAAGGLAVWAATSHADPALAGVLGLVVGAPLALGFHAAKSGGRGASSVGTVGLLNPVLSATEDFAVLVLGGVSVLAPLLAPLLLVPIFLLVWLVFRKIKRRRALAAQAA